MNLAILYATKFDSILQSVYWRVFLEPRNNFLGLGDLVHIDCKFQLEQKTKDGRKEPPAQFCAVLSLYRPFFIVLFEIPSQETTELILDKPVKGTRIKDNKQCELDQCRT